MRRVRWIAVLVLGALCVSSSVFAQSECLTKPATLEKRDLGGPVGERAAGVLIDTVNDPGPSLSYTNGGLDQGTAAGAGIIGMERDVVIRGTSDEAATLVISGGLLDYQVTHGDISLPDLFVIWDGAGDLIQTVEVNGLGRRDLTEGGANAFHVLGVTSTRETLLFISVFEPGGNIGFGEIVVPAGTTNGDFMIPFAAFSSSPDFTDIGAVALNVGFSVGAVPARVQINELNTLGALVSVEKTGWSQVKARFR